MSPAEKRLAHRPAEGVMEYNMSRFLTSRTSFFANLAFAVAWRFVIGVAPSSAAELPVYAQPTPLDLARQLEAATAGGLHDPGQRTPFDRQISQSGSDDEQDDGAAALPASSEHDRF